MTADQVHLMSDVTLLDILKLQTQRASVVHDSEAVRNRCNGIAPMPEAGRLIEAVEKEILRRMKYRTSRP